METTFGLRLKAFDRWPQFVECAQRRNLLTHCDGIVSQQYLKVCNAAGYKFTQPVNIGDRLDLGGEYTSAACELMMTVGMKLGQTLWRKLFPAEIDQADSHLIKITYDCLQREKWRLAQIYGEYANSQKEMSSDLNRRITTINYAIALKFGGKQSEAEELLRAIDWTATINEFKLAEAVLLDNFDKASEIMERIGKSGEIITENAYHVWPLFNTFRATTQFLAMYENVYGHPFVAEVKREAEKIEAAAREEIEKGGSNGKK